MSISVIPAVATTPATTVKLIKPIAVTLCARSAHTRPIRTVLSKLDSWPRFARAAAARNLAIFCCAVSPGGAWPKLICEPADEDGAGATLGGPFEAKEGPVEPAGLDSMYGPVAVKRVASSGRRAIVNVWLPLGAS